MKALEVRVRRIRVGDVERVIAIERAWPHLSHWSEDSYYRLVDDEHGSIGCLAEVEELGGGSTVAGYVIFRIIGDSCEVYNLAVDPRHARTGIGTQLMRAVIGESHRRFARRVTLEVRASNLPAIRFYERFGFTRLGERKAYYANPAEDALVMGKPLFTTTPS